MVGGGWYGTGIAKVVSVELHGAVVSHIGQSLEVGLVVVGALVERLDAAGPVVVVDILRVVVGTADRRERQIGRNSRDDCGHAIAIPFFQLVAEVNGYGNIGPIDAREQCNRLLDAVDGRTAVGVDDQGNTLGCAMIGSSLDCFYRSGDGVRRLIVTVDNHPKRGAHSCKLGKVGIEIGQGGGVKILPGIGPPKGAIDSKPLGGNLGVVGENL